MESQTTTERIEMPRKAVGVGRVIRAFGYSMEGVGSALKHEAAFRQEMMMAAWMLPFAIFAPVGLLGKALLITSVFGVLIVELLNSAIEWIVDYISLDRHPMAKRAKDMASAAVFLSIVSCITIWALVLWGARANLLDRF